MSIHVKKRKEEGIKLNDHQSVMFSLFLMR